MQEPVLREALLRAGRMEDRSIVNTVSSTVGAEVPVKEHIISVPKLEGAYLSLSGPPKSGNIQSHVDWAHHSPTGQGHCAHWSDVGPREGGSSAATGPPEGGDQVGPPLWI